MEKIFSHAKTAKKCHVLQMLKGQKGHVSFHTPGHKTPGWDITELSYSDCLAHPTGALLRAREDVEKIIGSKASEFLTDGSTSGVYALLSICKRKGVKKMAVSPFSHVSVFRGLAMMGIEPVLIEGQTALSQPTEKEMQAALCEADGILLTSPNYYGAIADLSAARRLCDKENKYFVVDGAHGAHLHHKPWQYAGSYADGWVDGAHKSLPAMTQGALVSVKREDWVDDLREAAATFRTTSPSYPILASIEYAYKYPRNPVLEGLASTFARENSHRIYFGGDWTKICVLFAGKAQAANDWFEKQGLYPEFCDGKFVLFYLSPATKIARFKKLIKAVQRAFTLFPVTEEEREQVFAPPRINGAKSGEKEWVEIEKAVGRVAAGAFGLFPPCLPLVCDGQVVEEQAIARLKRAQHTFGVKDGKVVVYTKGEK